MKSLLTLSFLAFFCCFSSFSQTEISLLKDPKWSVKATYDIPYGQTLNLSGNEIAMIVDMPNVDFAVLALDQKLGDKWTTPLAGFPLAIGKFKKDIMVIAASDRTFLKTFGGSYKAYLLDEKTGKILNEKIIYEGNRDYIEQPEFLFAKDASYFRMAVRLTGMKRKVGIFTTTLSDNKEYSNTQSYFIINYDQQLNQREKMSPKMPPGDTWTASSSDDGGLFIAAFDKANGLINMATYISSSPEPLKTLSLPVNLKNKADLSSILSIGSAKPLRYYLAVVYENKEKETELLTAKIDFGTGSCKTSKEVFDSKHAKVLEKSFVPVNKKLDDLQFTKLHFLGLRHMEEFGDKLLVSVAPAYTESSSSGARVSFAGSVLLNVYNEDLNHLYHQFIPRTYMSLMGEGSKLAYHLSNNTLKVIANNRPGSLNSLTSWYSEMDFNTGQMLKTTAIPDKEIKSGYYVNTGGIIWGEQSFIVPYLDRQRILSTKLGAQVQLLKYQ